eukprot:787900-Amphidinium_carterae.1
MVANNTNPPKEGRGSPRKERKKKEGGGGLTGLDNREHWLQCDPSTWSDLGRSQPVLGWGPKNPTMKTEIPEESTEPSASYIRQIAATTLNLIKEQEAVLSVWRRRLPLIEEGTDDYKAMQSQIEVVEQMLCVCVLCGSPPPIGDGVD